MAYKVTAPLVLAKNERDSDVYVYKGGIVTDQSDDWIKRHLADEMIVEVDDPVDSGDDSDEGEPDPFVAFLDRSAAEVIADVPSLEDEDVAAVAAAEEAGKNRVTVLQALADAVDSGDDSGND